jgi:hypothetical protein
MVHDSSSFIFTEPALSVEGWVSHPGDLGMENYILAIDGYNGGYRVKIDATNQLAFQLTGASYEVHSEGLVSSDAWHYLVATWDGETMRLYIDGIRDPRETPRPGSMDPTSSELAIGAGWAGGMCFTGRLDEIRVSNRAYSDAWIAAQHCSMTDGLITFSEE